MPTALPLRRRRPALLATACAAVMLGALGIALVPRASVADADGSEAQTAAAIEAVLADADLPSAIWGIVVRDARSGRVVMSRNADKNLLPASTLKLFTTATALDALGPTFRFATRLYHLGPEASGGVLRGDLVIRGSGDPTLGSSGQPDAFQRWAEALAATGVRRIEGRLIGDDDRFEDEPYGEGWDVHHIATESYAPATGGLAWADNLLPVRVEGGGRGPTVTAGPEGFATIRMDVESRRGRSRLRIERELGTDTYRVHGGVASGYRGTLQLPVANPTLYAVSAFAEALRTAGIDVSGARLLDVDDLDTPPSYDGAEPLLVHVSPTLADIVMRVNQESDNLYAEHLLRALTEQGSAEAGAQRVEAFVSEAGADADGLSIRDGSGLSRKDMVTPDAMAAVLRRMADHPAGGVFRASLPSGGGAGSTLRNRLDGVPVRAKTGSLEYVRCLAGYVQGPGGTPYVFVLMANNYTTGSSQITQAMDRIVQAVATGGRLPVEED